MGVFKNSYIRILVTPQRHDQKKSKSYCSVKSSMMKTMNSLPIQNMHKMLFADMSLKTRLKLSIYKREKNYQKWPKVIESDQMIKSDQNEQKW